MSRRIYVCEVVNVSVTEASKDDTVAEWLRRPTRNRLGFSRVGSSPASVDPFLPSFLFVESHSLFCYT